MGIRWQQRYNVYHVIILVSPVVLKLFLSRPPSEDKLISSIMNNIRETTDKTSQDEFY